MLLASVLMTASCSSIDLSIQPVEPAVASATGLAEEDLEPSVDFGTPDPAVVAEIVPQEPVGQETVAEPTMAERTLLAEVSDIRVLGSGQRSARVKRRPITLGFAGDTAFTGGLEQFDPLHEVTELLAAPDLMVVNLETAVADFGIGRPPVDKRFLFLSPPASLRLMAESGVDVVTLGNNHSLDFGYDALVAGLEGLEAVGLRAVGANADADAAYDPLVLEVGDWTIGLVSMSRVPCDWSWQGKNTRPGVAWACDPFLDSADAAVVAAVEQSDVAVVMVHGGTEGELCPNQAMRELNARWAALGADLIVNGHPHVLQGITSIGETLVVQSTGNFAFPPAFGLSANSAIFEVDVRDQGLFLRVVPVVAEGGVVRQPSDVRRRSILEQINQYSSGWAVGPDGSTSQEPERVGLCAFAAQP